MEFGSNAPKQKNARFRRNPPNLPQHYISIDDRSFPKQQMEAGCLWSSSIKCTSNYILKIANILGTRVQQLDTRGFGNI